MHTPENISSKCKNISAEILSLSLFILTFPTTFSDLKLKSGQKNREMENQRQTKND